LGFGVGGIRGLCVGRQNGQEFSFDSGDGSKRQLSPHGGYYFTLAVVWDCKHGQQTGFNRKLDCLAYLLYLESSVCESNHLFAG
jgi:hypothetical protein